MCVMDKTMPIRGTPTSLPDPPDDGIVDVIRVLVLLQGAFALLVVVEIVFWALFAGTVGALGPSLLLTVAAAAGSFCLAAGLRRHSRLARRLAFFVDGGILLFALVDLALAVFLAHRPLDLVPTITRLAMPAAVLVLLRRRSVRAVFGAGPSSFEGVRS